MEPIISIVTPSYNCALYLPSMAQSVLNQTLTNWELIIIDDGSVDDTERVMSPYAQNYPDKIHYFKIPHCGLPAVARNAGIRRAKGAYIAFLDADDTWLPEKIEKTLEIFKKYPNISIVGTAGQYMRDDELLPVSNRRGFITFYDLIRINSFITSSVVFKKNAIDTVGLMNESPIFRGGYEDYEFWLRILSIKGAGYNIAEPLVIYRINPLGLSQSNRSTKKDLENKITVFKELIKTNIAFIHKLSVAARIVRLYIVLVLYIFWQDDIRRILAIHK